MIEYPQNLQPLVQGDNTATMEHFRFLLSLVDGLNAAKSELGTESSGLFIRFENGLQICGHVFSVGSITTNGSGTYADPWRSNFIAWTYPRPFVSPPFVSVTPSTGNLGGIRDASMGYARIVTDTTASVQIARGSSNSTADVFSAICVAMGPWK